MGDRVGRAGREGVEILQVEEGGRGSFSWEGSWGD